MKASIKAAADSHRAPPPLEDVTCESGLAHLPQYSANVRICKDNEGSDTKGSVVVQEFPAVECHPPKCKKQNPNHHSRNNAVEGSTCRIDRLVGSRSEFGPGCLCRFDLGRALHRADCEKTPQPKPGQANTAYVCPDHLSRARGRQRYGGRDVDGGFCPCTIAAFTAVSGDTTGGMCSAVTYCFKPFGSSQSCAQA